MRSSSIVTCIFRTICEMSWMDAIRKHFLLHNTIDEDIFYKKRKEIFCESLTKIVPGLNQDLVMVFIFDKGIVNL